jgi:phosphoribosylaminoimidazole carboxylase PurE protein
MPRAQVAVVMGSDSDMEVAKAAAELLDSLQVPYQMRILSAHRTPDALIRFAKSAREGGFKVIICIAGGAAHLSGAVAANTLLPVIGVPVASSPLFGLDSLLSTAQMPSGVPVATMAIGSGGAKNAALFAAQILSLQDKNLAKRIEQFRAKIRESLLIKDRKLYREK